MKTEAATAKTLLDTQRETAEALLQKHTAFRTLADFDLSASRDGYVPTILPPAEELGKALEALGFRVWRSRDEMAKRTLADLDAAIDAGLAEYH